MLGSVSNFLNLNEILTNNYYFNYINLIIHPFVLIIKHYKYNNIYLIKNKYTYLITYNFKNFNDEYKYLFFIKAFYKSQNRTIWNFKIKYILLIINKKMMINTIQY